MTLDDLIFRVRELVGESGSDQTASRDEIVEYINEAYLEITGDAEYPFLEVQQTFTFEDGVDLYTLDTPLRRIEQVVINGDFPRPVHRVSTVQARAKSSATASDSLPDQYSLEDNGTLRFFPCPSTDETVTVYGYAQPTPMSAASDVPVMPAEHHPLIAYLAGAFLLMVRGGDPTGLMTRVDMTLSRLRKNELTSYDDGFIVMGSVPDSRHRANTRWRLS